MHNVVGYTMVLMLIGMFGILCSKRNIIVLLVEIELMLLASNFNFIVFSFWLDDSVGYIWAMLIFVLAAVEAALGLSLLIVYYRLRGIISASFITALKG